MPDEEIFQSGVMPNWREIAAGLAILQKDQFDALATAAGLEAAARAEAKETVARANAEAGEIREQARQEGFAQGRAEAKRAFEGISRRWDEIADRFDAELQSLLQGQAELIIGYASLLAERILLDRLDHPEIFRQHLSHLLHEESGRRCLMVYVHPQRAADIADVREHFPMLKDARVETDPSIGIADIRLGFERHRVEGGLRPMLQKGASILIADALRLSRRVDANDSRPV